MNVKQVKCTVCNSNSFHIFKMDDNGIYSHNEHICTKCGTHYSVEQVSPEYTAFWNEFVANMDKCDDIEFIEV